MNLINSRLLNRNYCIHLPRCSHQGASPKAEVVAGHHQGVAEEPSQAAAAEPQNPAERMPAAAVAAEHTDSTC